MRLASRSHTTRGERGFSTVELLVVVAIIVILGAVSVPSIVSFMKVYRIQGAAQQVVNEIAKARGRAISRNTNFGVLLIVLPPNTPPGNPTNLEGYRFVYEDPVYGQFPDNSSARRPTTTLLGWPEQLGLLQTLPVGITFGVPRPGGAPTPASAFRFNRLGRLCNPGVPLDVEPCPALDVASNLIAFDAGVGKVTLRQPSSGLSAEINVAQGGRITINRSWQ